MRIIGLSAENFKKLHSVNVSFPEGKNIIEIIGENGSGKSSLLDSVETALGGAEHTPFEAISHGEEECKLTVKMQDELMGQIVITKILRKDKKPSLVVSNIFGSKFDSPQEVLSKFIGTLSFDPSEFYNLKPSQQYDTLKEVLGLHKLDELENKNKEDYDKRTVVNRDIKSKQAQKEGLGVIGEEIKLIDVGRLVNKLQRVNEQNAVIDAEIVKHQTMQTKITETKKKIKDLELEVIAFKHELIKLEGMEKLYKNIEKTDINPLKKEIKDANENNQKYYEQKNIIEKNETLEKELTILTQQSENFTATMQKRESEKIKLMTKSGIDKLIPGLTIENRIIRYNGTSLQELSTAEQIRISFGIAVALNPRLKVVFIREGSLLDMKSKKLIVDLAKEKGYDIWVELINDDGKKDKGVMKIIIEDGSVVS